MMGSDQRVLRAARVSTGALSKGEEQDKRLIFYLMKHKHHTPFEKIVLEFHIRCPIFVARQWFRHRIGSFNEESGRYKELKTDFYIPNSWRIQSKRNKQSSEEKLTFTDEETKELSSKLNDFYLEVSKIYQFFLKKGIAREQARTVLPLGVYTEFYWTVNFRSLMNFIVLRDDLAAQFEIREYARAIQTLVKSTNKIPWTWEAFEKFNRESLT